LREPSRERKARAGPQRALPSPFDTHQDGLENTFEDFSGRWSSIMLPFTPEQFFNLFSRYNDAI
jgi:hypothetical protein